MSYFLRFFVAVSLILAIMPVLGATSTCGPVIVEAENRSPYMRGVPVPQELIVDDDISWARDYEKVLWTNQNVHKVLTVASISRGDTGASTLPYGVCSLSDAAFKTAAGESAPLTEVLASMGTDGFILLSDGVILAELYYNGMTPDVRHQLNSVSKSFVGLLAGIAADEGKIDLHRPVGEMIPELAGTGVADAGIQHALDMALALETPMSWSDPRSYRHLNFMAGGFYRRFADFPYRNTMELIATTQKNGQHGSLFFYSPANTELVAWSISHAYGKNWQDVLAEKIWSKIGAERDAFVIVDEGGHGFGTAGISATLRDLARFGMLVEKNGQVEEQQIVPKSWIQETIAGNDEVRSAMQNEEELTRFGGPVFYHNQFRILNSDEGELVALGGIGQMIYINQQHNIVAVFVATTFNRADRSHQLNVIRQIRDFLQT